MSTREQIECDWCKTRNEPDALSCVACGAHLDVRDVASDAGWREAPRIRDMTEIHFGKSTCQIEGRYVPVADMNLSKVDGIYFGHHVL